MSYSDKLKDPRWQKKRLKILERDNWTCQLCGDTETTLNIHHKKYVKGRAPWEYPDRDLVTICEHCHDEISREELNKIKFKDIKIYKDDGWSSGSRIMHISAPGIYIMRIYNGKNKFIIGFEHKYITSYKDRLLSIFRNSLRKR